MKYSKKITNFGAKIQICQIFWAKNSIFFNFEGRNNEQRKAIEERKRTSMNIQRLKNDLKILLECQALNKADRSLTDGPCVSFIFGMKIQLQTNILSTFF